MIEKIKSGKFFVILACGYFVLILILGLNVYDDYGISWDEPTQLSIGRDVYYYVVKGEPLSLSENLQSYGSIYELFLIGFQNHSSDRDIYLSRHLLTFLTFFSGLFFFFILAKRISQHKYYALLGVTLLLLSPRIFADSFYNSKDIPFMVFYLISITTLLYFLDKPNTIRLLTHGIISGLVIATRIPGVIILPITILGLFIEYFRNKFSKKSFLFTSIGYLVLGLLFSILFWPNLWEHPISNFIKAYQYMSHFPYDLTMLFMGNRISSTSLPWYYIPVWIGITTPIINLIGIVPGICIVFSKLKGWVHRTISIESRDQILIATAAIFPILIIIFSKSVLYNAWRQMFFIYPLLLIINLIGIQWFTKKISEMLPPRMVLPAVIILFFVSTIPTAYWMIQNHPYQNVYFNRIAGKDMQSIQQMYDMDYWGLAYRDGLEYLTSTITDHEINVFVETAPGQRNIAILPKEHAIRIHIVDDLSQADYFIGNYNTYTNPYPFTNEIFSVEIGNAKILSVYKLSPEEKE